MHSPNTIWVFTCNAEDRLQDRFLSRTLKLEFSNYAIQSEAVSLLSRVWETEAPGATIPNIARLVKEATGNIRESLMRLETELLLA